MKPIFRHTFLFLCLCSFIACNTHKKQDENSFSPSDKKATQKTVELFSALSLRMEKGIMLGHQDDLAYGNKWYGEPDRSDVKSVCGDYPAVFGWNIGNIEIDLKYNTDSVSFSKLRFYIKQANKLGGMSTLCWSPKNPTVNESEVNSVGNSVGEILHNKSPHEKYLLYLEKLSNFLNTLKDDEGNFITIIFQPFNEYNLPGKYWWSKNQCSATEFKEIWILTVDYLQKKKNIHHILYSYSIYADNTTNSFADYYPGNNYIDLIGVSLTLNQENDPSGKIYMKTLNNKLSIITQFAENNHKIAALTNTGMEGIKIPDYFSNYLYPIISQYKLAYVMFGRNSYNDEKHYFIPIPGHPASEDFDKFSKNPRILTCSKVS